VMPMPFRGPVGGLVCWRSKGRRVSNWLRPVVGSKLAQEMPAAAPVWPTQTIERASEAATEVGNCREMDC
jgi:hypothetical protein